MEYNRGWRTSTAKTRVVLKGEYLQALVGATYDGAPRDANNEISLILEHEIHHGPFVQLHEGNYRDWIFGLASIHSKIFLTGEAKKTLQAELGGDELLNINSEISIEGVVQVKLDGKPLKLKEHAGSNRVAWKGVQGEWEFSRDLKHLKGKMKLPGFDFDVKGKHYVGNDLAFSTERFKTTEGLWLGKGSFAASSLAVGEASAHISAVGIIMAGVMDGDKGMIDSSGSLQIDSLELNNKKYGPLKCVGSVKSLDAVAVKSLYDISRKMESSNNQHVDAQQFMTIIPQLLKSRPQVNLDEFNVHTEMGDLLGFVQFAIGGPQASDINNPQQIIQSIAAKSHITTPKALMREILSYQLNKSVRAKNALAAQLNQPGMSEAEINQEVAKLVEEEITKQLQAGFLIEKDQNYIVDVEFVQGQLKVNGQLMQGPPGVPGR